MAAAEHLLADRTYWDLTVEDVMAAAGLTRTAFYRYFPDMEAVLLAALAEISEELLEAAGRWLSFDADPDADMLAATTGLAEVYLRHGRMLLAFAEAAAGGAAMQKAWHDVVDSFVVPVRARLADLAAQGRSHLAHPDEAARALVWMTERYLLETYGRGLAVPVPVAAEMLAQVWRAAVFTE